MNAQHAKLIIRKTLRTAINAVIGCLAQHTLQKRSEKKSSVGKVLGIIALSVTGALLLFIVLIVVLIAIFYNSSNQTAQLTKQAAATETIKKEALGKRTNPVPLGTTHQLSVQQYVALTGFDKKDYNISITINSFVRGVLARMMIYTKNFMKALNILGGLYLKLRLMTRTH